MADSSRDSTWVPNSSFRERVFQFMAENPELATDAELVAHETDTTNVHGIADTSKVLVEGGAAGGDLTGSWPSPLLVNEAVSEGKIKNLAVSSGKLANEAVTEGKLGPEAVGTGKIKNLAVTEGKLGPEAVGTGKLANLAVSSGKLANEAVTEGKLGPEAVTAAKIKALTITGGRLANETIGNGQLGPESVSNSKIESKAVTDAKLSKPTLVGSVSEAGALVNGTGFTVERPETGKYKITLTNELTNNGVLTAMYTATPGAIAIPICAPSKKVFEVFWKKTADGTAANAAFQFFVKET